MIAMVLAAGLGTRLRPLTDRTAKPALPLLGTTLLGCNLELLSRAGIREVVVNASHLAGTVTRVVRAEAERLGLVLHLSLELPEPLGTGGALVCARPLLDRGEPFVLVNGDMLSDLDVSLALEAHRASGAATTMVLRERPEGSPYGAVEVDEKGDVARIAGHGREGAGHLPSYVFTGLSILGPSIFEVLPPSGESCVNRQGQARLIARGDRVHGHLWQGGTWSDVGTPERYAAANLDLLDGLLDVGSPLRNTRSVAPGIHIHEGAQVSSGTELLAPCYVGQQARIEPGAQVGPRAVVLAGARVAGRVEGAVVAEGAEVARGARSEGPLFR